MKEQRWIVNSIGGAETQPRERILEATEIFRESKQNVTKRDRTFEREKMPETKNLFLEC